MAWANGEDHHRAGLEVDDFDVPAAMRGPSEVETLGRHRPGPGHQLTFSVLPSDQREEVHSPLHVAGQSPKGIHGDPALIPVAKAKGETRGRAFAGVCDHIGDKAITTFKVVAHCVGCDRRGDGTGHLQGSNKGVVWLSTDGGCTNWATVTSSGSNIPPLYCWAGVRAAAAVSGVPVRSAELAMSWRTRWRCLVGQVGPSANSGSVLQHIVGLMVPEVYATGWSNLHVAMVSVYLSAASEDGAEKLRIWKATP
eukprot:1731846-Amphidinium_carterae.1